MTSKTRKSSGAFSMIMVLVLVQGTFLYVDVELKLSDPS